MSSVGDRQFEAYQAFLLGCKLHWTGRIFPALHAQYRDKAERAANAGTPVTDATDVAKLMEGETLYRNFAWLERHLQRFKYSGRWGLQPVHDAARDELVAELDAPIPEGLLELDPDFEIPTYFRSVDIHQHPGGIWSDAIAGYVYERGARSTTPLLDRDKDLHYRFTRLVNERKQGRRILDMGCGFGKSTRPFWEENRDADVVGVDIAGPCLRLAAHDAAAAQARNVRFLQRDCRRTGLPDASRDVVTSTMVIHEMPPPAIRDTFAEAMRVLEPGGLMIHLDFIPADDPFMHFMHYGHGRRNNEPYMEPMVKMDVKQTMRDLGFRNVETFDFEEMPGALASRFERWRFPWTVIVGEK
ncbi:MAG: class I SAM-dependent methyltransferase [Alphaproteobacteria bacterium]|nr:class I SAM-dependent methyltransferase [Alphaproteobacteria bacterium]